MLHVKAVIIGGAAMVAFLGAVYALAKVVPENTIAGALLLFSAYCFGRAILLMRSA